MLLENKFIIFIHDYNKLNCSHLKGFMTYLKLKPKFDNLILINYSDNNFNLYQNKKFFKKEIEFKNNKILFIKFLLDINKLIDLTKNNNILYHEIVDFYYNKKYKSEEEYFNEYKYNNKFIFDKIIVNSDYMKNNLLNHTNNIYTIYHQYDKRIRVNNKIINKVYYFGLKEKLNISDEIINKYIKIIDYNGIKKYLQNAFSCIHVCFLFNESNILFNTYTSTKLATAIITNSIFICNKIPIFVELLGNDYEFYCEDKNELGKVIKKAQNLLNNKNDYQKFIEKYNFLKKKLSYEELLKDYEKIILL